MFFKTNYTNLSIINDNILNKQWQVVMFRCFFYQKSSDVGLLFDIKIKQSIITTSMVTFLDVKKMAS